MNATWKKLDDGSWGIYVQAQQAALLPLLVGQEVEVFRKSDGTTSTQRVTEVVKLVKPRPAVTVRGRYLAAVTTPGAVCRVVLTPAPERVKSDRPARKPRAARSSETTSSPLTQAFQFKGASAASFSDLLALPSKLSAESTLTRE